MFLNLITNAADAIADSGDIFLSTWEKDGKVGVSVADTGSGIPEDVLPKIRNPFFTTKEVGKGTGLGLSIVDQIVTSHHGELQVQSELGKGTTVTVVFPILASDGTVDAGHGSPGGLPVLIADDSPAASATKEEPDSFPDLATV